MNSISPELQRAVMALAQAVDLENIRVIGFSARLLKEPSAGQTITASVDSKLSTSPSLGGGFVVECQFALRGLLNAEADDAFLDVQYNVGAVYRLPAERELPPSEVLDAFAQTNGMVHLWPYFRAFVQQTSAQLALPPLVLPPFRVVRSEGEAPQ